LKRRLNQLLAATVARQGRARASIIVGVKCGVPILFSDIENPLIF
jgi:hypothetical protein